MQRLVRSPPQAPPPPPAPRWLDRWPALALVVGVALAVRLLHLVDAARLPIFDRPSVDAALYVDAARDLSRTWDLPAVFFKPPLYPVLLAAWWSIVGASWFWLRIPGVVAGALTCSIVWLLGRRIFDARVALLAGLLYALHRTAVYFDAELLEIGVATLLQVGALLLVRRAARAPRQRAAASLAGLALGLGSVARPTFLLFVLVALAWLGKRRIAPALAGVALAVLPVTLHNAVRGRDLVLVSSNLGVNFYLGNNARANGRIAAAAELPANPEAARRTSEALAVQAAGRTLRPSQVSDYWLRRGLAWDLAHPTQALALAGRKLFFAWNAAEISDNEDLSGLGRHLRLFRFLPVGMWLLAPLGLVGLVAATRARARRERLPWYRTAAGLGALFVACQMASLLPFFVVARFRLPWVPVLALFAAWTALEIIDRVRRRARVARLVGACAAAGLLCNLPLLGVRAPVDFDLDYKIAWAYQQKGQRDAALAAYRQAVARNPRGALARNALGVLLAERGESLDEAARLIAEAIRLDPPRAANYFESLAGVELRRGDPAAADSAGAAGLAANPDASTRASLWLRRAEARRRGGDAAAEVEALRAALEGGLDAPRTQDIQKRLSALGVAARVATDSGAMPPPAAARIPPSR